MLRKIKRLIRKKNRPVPKFEGAEAPKANRIERSHRRRNFQMLSLFLCLIGLLGGYALFRIYTQADRRQEVNDVVVYTSFKAQLENSTPQQLADFYLDNKENPLASLPERIDHFKKKNKVARRLVNSGEGKLREFGSAACFELLARRDSLLLMHGLIDLDSDGEKIRSRYLDELSDLDGMIRSGSESDASVLMSRQLAVLLGEYFTVYSKSKKTDEPFAELYAKTAKQCSGNERLIVILFDIAMHAFRNDAGDKPMEAFIAQFDSKPLGNDLAVFGADRLSRRDFEVASRSYYDAKSSGVVDKAFESVKTDISKTAVPTELSVQLERISDFSKLGEAERGRELLELLEPKISEVNFSRLKNRFDQLVARFGNFGKEFSLDGVRTLDNENAAFRHPDSRMKIILVGNTKTRAESQVLLQDAVRLNRSQKNTKGKMDLSIAFLVHNIGGQTNGMNQLKKAARQISEIDFWQVSSNTEAGQEFLKKLPLNNAPFFIVLDENNHPISIGSDATMVEEIVSQVR